MEIKNLNELKAQAHKPQEWGRRTGWDPPSSTHMGAANCRM